MTFRNALAQRLALILAIFAGGLVFLDYFTVIPALRTPTQIILKTVMLTSAAALALAAFNLLLRHARQIRTRNPESVLLTAGFIIMFGAGFLPSAYRAGLGHWLYEWLLAPGMAATFALLPIFLAYALFRRLDIRSLGGILLFLAFVVVLLGQIPWFSHALPWLATIRRLTLVDGASVAFRGVLMGIAMGVLITLLTRLFPRLR